MNHEMTSRFDRRQFTTGTIGAFLATAIPVRYVAAHNDHAAATAVSAPHGTPTSDVEQFPQLQFVQNDEGYLMPETFEAGLYRVRFVNETAIEQHCFFLQLADGVDEVGFQSLMSDPEAAAPEWMNTATIIGAPDHAPVNGGVAEGFARFDAGIYYVVDPFGGKFARIEVTGESTGTLEPEADVHISMVEMAFVGLEEPIATGRQLWRIANDGVTFHEILVLSVPAGRTVDEIITDISVESEEGPEGYGSFNAIPLATGIQSAGTTSWVYGDLVPGSYAAFCFAPDQWVGPPHAFMGMITPFTVA